MLYLSLFSASFCVTILSAGIATSIIMHVATSISMHVATSISMHVATSISMHVDTSISMHVATSNSMHVATSISMHVATSIRMHVGTSVSMHVDTSITMHVDTSISMHVSSFRHLRKLRKRLLFSSCLSIRIKQLRLSLDGFSWNLFEHFWKNLLRKLKCHYNLTSKTVTLREDLYTFMTISCRILLRVRKFWDKVVENIKTIILCTITFFPRRRAV